MMMLGGAATVVVGGMYAHGDFQGGEIYNLPAAQVFSELSNMPPHPHVASANGALSGTYLRVERDPGAAVSWAFYHGDERIGSVVARVKAEGEARTRVSTEFVAGEGDAAKWHTGDVRQFLKIVVRPMMAEQVDAELENREFNSAVMTQALTGYVMANTGALQREGVPRMEEATSYEKMSPEEMQSRMGKERWYQDVHAKAQAIGARATVRTDGRPMTDTQPMIDTRR